ncbi:MAG: aminopeptidase P family protein [Lachnospiraceae bacterium]|nr:aminopeptidase P family protein [Lachnospiraceae bacterium]
MKEMIKERLQLLRGEMAKEGIDCYLIFTSDHHQSEYVDDAFKTRAYISGFTGSAGTVAVMQERAILWADGRYHVQAAHQIEGTGIELFRQGITGVPTLKEFLRDAIKEEVVVACDGRTISASFCKELAEAVSPGILRTDIDLFVKIWTDRPKITARPVYELPLTVSGKSRIDKIDHIRRKIKEKDAEAYVLADLSSVMWLFNIRGSDVTCNPVAFSYAYITPREAYLFLQNDVLNAEVRAALTADGVFVLPYEEAENFFANITGLNILADPEELNSRNEAILSSHNRIIPVKNHEMTPKQIKNETEIALARKFHETDAVSVIRFIRYIKDAVNTEELTECDAAAYIDRLRRENEGYTDLSFETICAYGPNGAIIHYAPEENSCAALKPEGFLLVDSGAQYLGATTDITRTIALGPLKEIEKRDYTAVLKAVIALANAKFIEGVSGANLDILARGPIWNLGLDYRHGTGHGIGAFLNVHEGPQNFRYKTPDHEPVPIMPGMITSDEPGIYIENSHGIRIENELLCIPYLENEWGKFHAFETLTLVPFEREAILTSMLEQSEINWINDYHERVYETISPYLKDDEKAWLETVVRPL